jgi:anthranilate synthase component 2
MKTLIIDNFDSFTYNLYQTVGKLNGKPVVFRNNELTIQKIKKINPTHIIISPGATDPTDDKYFGICREVIKKLGPKIPILGVCLGHQGIIYVFGGKIIKAPAPMHGKTSLIYHNLSGLFKDVQNPFLAMRYHSLIGDTATLPECLEITAKTDDGIIMGVKHRQYPLFGIQFHPESIGTPEGEKILRNFFCQYPRPR